MKFHRSVRPPGAAARPGRVRRALSLGRKRNRADGRRALPRRLLCGEPRAPSAELRRGSEGGGGGISPTPEPGSEGTPECRLRAADEGRAREE